ncbi:restriction endonuclease [Aureibaculum algae]|uniref:Restriction endonuclease n=1 Tax=Aureibaculum algae TaxID=2584122 RepID=A0A5B7TXR1_9FLAO|nr:restriction endonuclease [Aureibaculum algae]QCX40041.1 restriction endonuclease [Aureibaculum algae]
MKSFVELDKENESEYLNLLSAVSKLSGLFSDNSIPLINYRVAENIFCKSFNADNLSRSDTAFDANYKSVGVGLKTFTCPSSNSNEKIAEFNSLSSELKELKGKKLAIRLAEYRNQRINLAKRNYNINASIYHIVARKKNELVLFETDYDNIDIDNIQNQKKTKAGWSFEDGNNFYSFNYSKSTLYRKFIIPDNAFRLPISIIKDPYSLLLNIFKDKVLPLASDSLTRGVNYVVLPLYSTKYKDKRVSEKSGLNQWNAGGRNRNIGEVYIPIPIEIHKQFPFFFPERDEPFKLKVPTGEIYDAKVCQDNSKALMTNPNKDLSNWLLRNVLKLKEGELATMDKLNKLGLDSVILIKDNEGIFKIDIMKTDSYIDFLENK